MGGVVSAIKGLFSKPQKSGPSAAELAIQKEREKKAFENESDADAATAAVSTLSSRRKSLAFQDTKKKQTLGG